MGTRWLPGIRRAGRTGAGRGSLLLQHGGDMPPICMLQCVHTSCCCFCLAHPCHTLQARPPFTAGNHLHPPLCASMPLPSPPTPLPPALACSAGTAAILPLAVTGIHHFVHSLATPMRFKLRLGGGPAVRGWALAHFEKDRGISFPSSWHWAQGINASWTEVQEAGGAADGEAACSPAAGWDETSTAQQARPAGCGPVAAVNGVFTLAGGPPPTPLPVPEGWLPDVWLLGVRTRTRRWVGLGGGPGRVAQSR